MSIVEIAGAAAEDSGAAGVSAWAAWVGAATGVVALLLTWRAAVRESRAQLPVGWHVEPEERAAPPNSKTPSYYVVKLSPMFNDAHSFELEVYHPGATAMPSGLTFTQTATVLRVGEEVEIALQNGANPGTAFVRIFWCHPRDVTHKNGMWMPLIPRRWKGLETPAADEFFRQISRPAAVRWFRERVLLSPIQPGRGIVGRRAGWRDFREGRRRLSKEGVRRWDWKADLAPSPAASAVFPDGER